MPYKMTQDQTEQYAKRMYNDDCWEKKYAPDIEALKLVEDHEYGVHLVLPVSMTVERNYVSEDDNEEYQERPGAVDKELADDDKGLITLQCALAIPYPINMDKVVQEQLEATIKNLGIELKECGNGSMYDGAVQLGVSATQHLISRINETYIVLDTLHQNPDLIQMVSNKASSLCQKNA